MANARKGFISCQPERRYDGPDCSIVMPKMWFYNDGQVWATAYTFDDLCKGLPELLEQHKTTDNSAVR